MGDRTPPSISGNQFLNFDCTEGDFQLALLFLVELAELYIAGCGVVVDFIGNELGVVFDEVLDFVVGHVRKMRGFFGYVENYFHLFSKRGGSLTGSLEAAMGAGGCVSVDSSSHDALTAPDEC